MARSITPATISGLGAELHSNSYLPRSCLCLAAGVEGGLRESAGRFGGVCTTGNGREVPVPVCASGQAGIDAHVLKLMQDACDNILFFHFRDEREIRSSCKQCSSCRTVRCFIRYHMIISLVNMEMERERERERDRLIDTDAEEYIKLQDSHTLTTARFGTKARRTFDSNDVFTATPSDTPCQTQLVISLALPHGSGLQPDRELSLECICIPVLNLQLVSYRIGALASGHAAAGRTRKMEGYRAGTY